MRALHDLLFARPDHLLVADGLLVYGVGLAAVLVGQSSGALRAMPLASASVVVTAAGGLMLIGTFLGGLVIGRRLAALAG